MTRRAFTAFCGRSRSGERAPTQDHQIRAVEDGGPLPRIVGDLGGYTHDQMGVFLEDTQVGTIGVANGVMVEAVYDNIAVTDGQLNLRIKDLGGSGVYVVLNGLEVSSSSSAQSGSAAVSFDPIGENLIFGCCFTMTLDETTDAESFSALDSKANPRVHETTPASLLARSLARREPHLRFTHGRPGPAQLRLNAHAADVIMESLDELLEPCDDRGFFNSFAEMRSAARAFRSR